MQMTCQVEFTTIHSNYSQRIHIFYRNNLSYEERNEDDNTNQKTERKKNK